MSKNESVLVREAGSSPSRLLACYYPRFRERLHERLHERLQWDSGRQVVPLQGSRHVSNTTYFRFHLNIYHYMSCTYFFSFFKITFVARSRPLSTMAKSPEPSTWS